MLEKLLYIQVLTCIQLKKLKMERVVCVGWIESYVKSIEEREYLFDLDAGARGLLAKHGRSDELDLFSNHILISLDYLVIK